MPAMRVALLIAAIAAAATASPFPWADAAAATSVASMPVPSNGTSPTRTGHHNPHKEPTPTFKTGCNCQKPIMPIDMLTEDEVSSGNGGQ